MPDYSGLSIGRYHIIEPLGQGGMATVYRAFDTRLDCDVAIKFIRMERLTGEEKERALKRFEREAKELARLTHPNIVKVTDFGKFRGAPYLVMEYLPGGTLKSLAGKPLPYDQAAHLLAPVARALEYAHEENIVHRDIKPGNILLTARGQPMLSDFGIAKILDVEGGHTLTSTNVAVGTPEYMAPEQWLNQVSAQSDIYALGVVFYELVTGQRPYTADTPAAIFLKQSTDPLPRPHSFVPGLSEEVEQVLYKALAKKSEERYASMGEFAVALEGLASPAKTAQPARLKPEVSEAVSVRPPTPAPASKPAPQKVVQPQKNEPGNPVPPPSVNKPQPADRRVTPASPPAKKAPTKSSTGRKILTVIGVITLIELVAVIGWGYSKYPLVSAWVQTAQAQIQMLATSTPTGTLRANFGIGATQVSPKDNMVMMYVPAGEFLMGSDKAKDSQANNDETPQHRVFLDAFWIDQTEVTNAQYALCVADTRCAPLVNPSLSTNLPVVNLDWNQAQAYCTWAGKRLPSEAEWEKAARGTDGRLYPWGNTAPDKSLLSYNNNQDNPSAVDSYPSGASPYGALDMAGNVYEWVNDWYSDSYYPQSPARNPLGPDTGIYRVLRGGSWTSNDWGVRTTIRGRVSPGLKYNYIGVRCAATAAAAPVTSMTPTPNKTVSPALTPNPTLKIGSTQVSARDDMVQLYVPADEFMMGSAENDSTANSDEKPQHSVFLDAFWIDQTEVTNTEYARCVASGQCTSPKNTSSSTASGYYGNKQFADYPVIYIYWEQAQAYCTWAGRRLPSEAEWEKAARGSDGRIYPWGSTIPTKMLLNFNSIVNETSAVGSYPSGASPYGALDMAGNVWEWVSDWYSSSYYQQSPTRNPTGPSTGTYHVLRGGSFYNLGKFVRSAGRYWGPSDYLYNGIGFRCAAGTSR